MFNKAAVIFVVLGVAVAGYLLFQKNIRDAHQKDAEMTRGPSLVIKLDSQSFDAEMTRQKGLVLADFSATWCGPCRIMAPVIEELAAEYAGKVGFANVDVDKSPELAKRFAISGIPLLVLIQDGKTLDQKVGVVSKTELKTWIDGALKTR